MQQAWETVEEHVAGGAGVCTQRLKVHGGWLVRVTLSLPGHVEMSMAFVPDPQHEWDFE